MSPTRSTWASSGIAFEEGVRQKEIEHRGLIYYKGLCLQKMVLIMPELHPSRVEGQHAVDGFSFHAGQLRKALGSTRQSFRESHFGVVKGRRVAYQLIRQVSISLLNDELLFPGHAVDECLNARWVNGRLRQGQSFRGSLDHFCHREKTVSLLRG